MIAINEIKDSEKCLKTVLGESRSEKIVEFGNLENLEIED